MKENCTSLQDYLAELHDHLSRTDKFGVLQPRRTQPPGGFDSFKCVAPTVYLLANQCRNAVRDHIPEEKPIDRTGLSIAFQIIKHGVPVYYVSETFIRAVAATELPGDFTLGDLHWPMPGMVLGFPRRFIDEYCGLSTSYVYCANLPAGSYHPPAVMDDIPGTEVPFGKIAFQYFAWRPSSVESAKEPVIEAFVGAYPHKDRVDEALLKHVYLDAMNVGERAKKEHENRLLAVARLLFKLLAVLNIRGDLIENAACTRPARIKQGQTVRDALWSGIIIGRAYQPQRAPATDSNRAGLSMHWRRGHLTWQVMGPRVDVVPINTLPRLEDESVDFVKVDAALKQKFLASHKRLWLEPVLVGMGQSS